MSSLAHALKNRLDIHNVTVKTSSGNVTMANEGVVVVNKSSGAATTVTLNPNPRKGFFAFVIDGKGDAATNNITVNGAAAETINGASTHTLSENYGAVAFAYNGTEWNVVSTFNAVGAAELAFLNGITAGTTTASKAVVTNSENEITFAASTTPASVGTTPGTAAGAILTITGGVGGATSIATTGVGGIGAGFAMTGGAGGAAGAATTSATGGAGGAFTLAGGAGGASTIATTTGIGGAGGAYSFTSGAGGAVSGAVGTATGGASGNITFVTGTGGAVTATTGTNTGGASGAVTIGSGVGGAASGATDTGGASGTVTVTSGTGGAGDTGGASGNVVIATGAAGAGGSPAVGFIGFNPGAAEKWRIEAAGNMTSVAGTPANAATTDGAILATGGIAFTDVANAWIDDATHGDGTVQHFIGNETIDTTAPSDRRLKKNIEPTRIEALPLLQQLEMVDFSWRNEEAGTERQFGFIAQQVHEVIPHLAGPQEGAGGMFYVKKHELVPYLVKALQELSKEVESLKAKLKG